MWSSVKFEAWSGQVNIQEPEKRWASLPPSTVQKDIHDDSRVNRQRLWHGMPVVVMAGPHKSKEGFIRSVSEYFDRPDSNKLASENREHRCYINCASCTLGYAFGHICSNRCLNICSQRALARDVFPERGELYLSSVTVEVALSAALGSVRTFKVEEIRVHEWVIQRSLC